MPVPKKRHSNSRQGKRRASNYKLAPATLSRCATCGAAVLPHHACPSCGNYRGRPILKLKAEKNTEKKTEKKEKPSKKTKGKEKK
ncbi:MAG: 50S ribosomal protein L32 [Candidatus Saganbacteria bacterium]|nr:50S ribosomal protein L32 [Candidatus Saganbacteria bacterium]